MKAVLLRAYGGVEQLELNSDWPKPEAGPSEVLVRVHATSLNPIDWKIRSGAAKERFPQTFPAILGRDLAGEVVSDGHSALKKGARVMALADHTYAEYTAVQADTLAPVPDALDFESAAALPLVMLTGAQLIERAAKVQRGQHVLITGALGGVGRTAVYVALQHGAHVTAGVRKSQIEEAQSLNAQRVIALDDEAQMKTLQGLDVVADTVGGKIAQELLRALKPGGTYASVVGPPEGADKFDVKIATMTAQPDASRLGELARDEANGAFHIPIAKVMPLSQVRQAHEMGEKGGVGGKIVLIP